MNLFFVTIDITIRGGIERVISNMANSLCNIYNIEILSIYKSNLDIAYTLDKRIKTKFLTKGKYDLSTSISKVRSNIKILNSLRDLRFHEDDVIISTTVNISILLSLLKNKIGNPKIIAAEHGHYNKVSTATIYFRKLLYNKLNAVVTLTDEDLTYYKFYKGKKLTIPNSLSFYPSNGSDPGAKRILAAGRLVKEKQFEILLYVYNILAGKYPDWDFVLYGDGELFNKLKGIIHTENSNIALMPSTPNIKDEMLKSSIYCCTSMTEAFPMVMLESMACGLSVISFDCPVGPRALITNEVNGLLIENGNVEEFIEKLEILINNFNLRKCLSINARVSAKYYLPENISNLWITLIKSL